jgi:hypothetical protein
MHIQLNNDQIDFICHLYETDESFRRIVNDKIEQKVAEAKKELESISVIKSQFTEPLKKTKLVENNRPSDTVEKRKRFSGGNYRDDILNILKNKPGITVNDIHEEMKKLNPNIDRHVLASTISNMKSKQHLKVEGVKPNMKYFTT